MPNTPTPPSASAAALRLPLPAWTLPASSSPSTPTPNANQPVPTLIELPSLVMHKEGKEQQQERKLLVEVMKNAVSTLSSNAQGAFTTDRDRLPHMPLLATNTQPAPVIIMNPTFANIAPPPEFKGHDQDEIDAHITHLELVFYIDQLEGNQCFATDIQKILYSLVCFKLGDALEWHNECFTRLKPGGDLVGINLDSWWGNPNHAEDARRMVTTMVQGERDLAEDFLIALIGTYISLAGTPIYARTPTSKSCVPNLSGRSNGRSMGTMSHLQHSKPRLWRSAEGFRGMKRLSVTNGTCSRWRQSSPTLSTISSHLPPPPHQPCLVAPLRVEHHLLQTPPTPCNATRLLTLGLDYTYPYSIYLHLYFHSSPQEVFEDDRHRETVIRAVRADMAEADNEEGLGDGEA
ncbi:hypothetical protein BKA70DRAFT_1216694 [Coprinopsis sp. MPI-PUGE-AT-0042]|nr:hypothetical protein BKA70DRAFT_1216694 [Coprinopsis sp. MPI-PUGE-AT-0042]